MLFANERLNFFRPLMGKYREQVVPCLRELYSRLYSSLADYSRVIGRELVLEVSWWVAATFAPEHPTLVKKLVLVDAAGFKAMYEGPPPVDFYPRDVAAMTKLLEHVRHDPATHTPACAEQALKASMASGDAQAAEAVDKGMSASPRLEVGEESTKN